MFVAFFFKSGGKLLRFTSAFFLRNLGLGYEKIVIEKLANESFS
jgi:hypothetical protein